MTIDAQKDMNNATAVQIPWWRRISSGLVMNSLFLSIVPLFLVIMATLFLTRDQINSQIFRQLESVSVLKQQQISEWIESGHTTLRLIADNVQFNNTITEVLQTDEAEDSAYIVMNTILSDAVRADSHFDRMFLYTPEGQIIAASDEVFVGRIVSRQPYFVNSLDGVGHTQAPYYDVGTRQLSLIITHPVRDTDNQLIGIIAGSLATDTLEQIMLDRTGLGETGETYLVSSENNYLLTSSRVEGYNVNQAYRSLGIDAALDGQIGADIYTSYQDVLVFGNYEWIPQIQVALLSEVEVTEAFSIIRQLSILTFGIAVSVSIVAISIGLFFALRISRPITELTNIATYIAQGNLTQRVQIQSQNEIGQLATSFNDMAAQLEGLIGSLEQRVAARTRDLEIAADVSRQVSRVLDMKQLLPYLVNTTHEGFRLAHVSIFLYQSETDILRLAASSGDIGQIMMDEGKQFHLNDRGLVPLTARTSEHQIINNVQASNEYFVNPLLPDTRSETAVPMRVGTRLIGVLDLQSNEVDHFSDEQLAVLTSLADQIAIAVQNAELFAEAKAAREAAERSDEVKSSFLASMSHELRTPLNSVINFTKFVMRGVMGPVTERQEETLAKVITSGQHLLSLINDVLDMSKIESGSLNLFVEDDVDPNTILETVISSAESLLHDKPVELHLDIQSRLPIMRADRKRITQILLNVVSNACKFTEEGFVKVQARLEDDQLLVSVQDTGFGIEEEDTDAVFLSFKQTNTGLRQGEGTGLGMPISKSLAEAHGGKLWFESEVGKGTTFYVTLPIQSELLETIV